MMPPRTLVRDFLAGLFSIALLSGLPVVFAAVFATGRGWWAGVAIGLLWLLNGIIFVRIAMVSKAVGVIESQAQWDQILTEMDALSEQARADRNAAEAARPVTPIVDRTFYHPPHPH